MGDSASSAFKRQLYKCIERLIKDVDTQEKAVDELSIYIKAEGVFGMDSAIRKEDQSTRLVT